MDATAEDMGKPGPNPNTKEQITNNRAKPPSGLVRQGDRPAEITSFDEAVVSFFVDAADMLGVPKSVAAIYGICFASPEPLSFSDIDDRLDISSGSISQGLRVLKEVGALKIAAPDKSVDPAPSTATNVNQLDGATMRMALSRQRERYEPDLDLRNLVLRWIERRLQRQLTTGRDRLQQLIDSISATASEAEKLKARFGSLQSWHDKAQSLLPIAKTFFKVT